LLRPLQVVLGAELAATRKVTDRGWLPPSRQVGITGRMIAPSLYLAIGIGGSPNHLAGVRRAGTILAVNSNADAAVFESADVGIVRDWRELVPALVRELRTGTTRQPEAVR
jgi:electron transfer flavoprotein alpha subunit